MELEKKIKIECPSCKTTSDFEVYENINTKIYPDLKDQIKSGDLFLFTCPKCQTETIVDYGLIYQDPEEKILIQYCKNEDEKNAALGLFNKENMDDIDKAQEIIGILDSYDKRLVESLEDLIEKIKIFDRGLDDRLVELIKIFALDFFSKDQPHQLLKNIFYTDEDGKDLIIFETEDDFFALDMDENLYNFLKAKLRDLNLDEAYVVDHTWAGEVFDKLVKLG